MAEYIVDYTKSQMYIGFEEDHEPIVRCRDCKWYRETTFFYYTSKQCTRTCWAGNTDRYTDVSPDGFCAWGERKVAR